VAKRLELGIPGIGMAPGDHICGFYVGLKERDEVLLPYLRAGLRAGDKCICIVDATEPSVVLDGIGPEVDVQEFVASNQLDVVKSTDSYLRNGQFSSDEMIGFWNAAVSAAMNAGQFELVRAVGEMCWSLRDVPAVDEMMRFEAELNRMTPLYPQVILCLYDLQRFGGGIMIDLLKTHPKLLLGGMILDNPHYLSPAEFLGSRSDGP
jgi:hypothetical protein